MKFADGTKFEDSSTEECLGYCSNELNDLQGEAIEMELNSS